MNTLKNYFNNKNNKKRLNYKLSCLLDAKLFIICFFLKKRKINTRMYLRRINMKLGPKTRPYKRETCVCLSSNLVRFKVN